tara:strand:+ start:460 stop:789 length:330 start_codon:yes stop_codon:yes gene_type:complete
MAKISDSSNLSFSLSYLVQLVGGIAIATYAFSEINNRLGIVENTSTSNSSNIEEIVKAQEKNQNALIPADYRQFEILKAHKEILAQHEAEIIRLQDKVYQLNRILSIRR